MTENNDIDYINDYSFPDDYTLGVEIDEVKVIDKSSDNKKKKESIKRQGKRADKKSEQKKRNTFWVIRIFIVTLVLSAIFLVITESVLQAKNILLSIIILVVLLAINILFDMIGTAAASADIEPFISKASRKEKGGLAGVKLLQNAERVTSFCNDVVGDICGIVSGGCASAVVLIIVSGTTGKELIISVAFSAIISSLTVGGKAIGKLIGMKNSHQIVLFVAKIASIFFPSTKNNKKKK